VGCRRKVIKLKLVEQVAVERVEKKVSVSQ
jgi:hypothetical protein